MLYLNSYEIEEALRRYADHPVLGPATQQLAELEEWTNRNSDGWAYWQKPGRAAQKLQALIGTARDYLDNPERPDATEARYREALTPIKAFRTRQGADFHLYEPGAEPEPEPDPEPTPIESALRALQKLDEIETLKARHLLIEAESALGDALGLDCTGEPDGWNEDGSVAFYSHNGDTCPVHEWLDPSDQAEAERVRENLRPKEEPCPS